MLVTSQQFNWYRHNMIRLRVIIEYMEYTYIWKEKDKKHSDCRRTFFSSVTYTDNMVRFLLRIGLCGMKLWESGTSKYVHFVRENINLAF